MSLKATHIRFALDLMSGYDVKEKEKYISGCVYPDSRYITGIDRMLTHNDDILNSEFAKDDFRKGWQAHQICDMAHNCAFRQNIPMLDRHDKESGYNEERFVEFSAVKVVQDINDMQCFNLQECLEYLEYVHNPNGEDLEKIRSYNKIVADLYKNKKQTTFHDNYVMWRDLGIGENLAKKIMRKAEEFAKNKVLKKQIESCYEAALNIGKEFLKNASL